MTNLAQPLLHCLHVEPKKRITGIERFTGCLFSVINIAVVMKLIIVFVHVHFHA